MIKIKAFLLGALLLVCVASLPTSLDQMKLEEPCVRQGGMCVHLNQCSEHNRAQLGPVLCPQQASRGFTCCYIDYDSRRATSMLDIFGKNYGANFS